VAIAVTASSGCKEGAAATTTVNIADLAQAAGALGHLSGWRHGRHAAAIRKGGTTKSPTRPEEATSMTITTIPASTGAQNVPKLSVSVAVQARSAVHLGAGMIHRVVATADLTLVEVSTAAPGWRGDEVRLSDAYGREGRSAS
jgi:hypothetical protein